MSTNSKILMLGLRSSGKTTFLAALWHHLEAGESEGRLIVHDLQADRHYLNAIRNNWLAVKPVGRTSARATTTVTLNIRDTVKEADIAISVPDLSGESFRQQWANRKASAAYEEYARDCSGVFLFIHPAEVRRTHAIKVADSEKHSAAPDEKPISPSAEWEANQSSTQVQLVDVLQLLLAMRERRDSLRIAIIVSAWDKVKVAVSPMGWLESRLPLLFQFLVANTTTLEFEAFGVSAQGGDLIDDKEQLLSMPVPSKRARATVGNSLDQVEITAPLEFLIGTAFDGEDR